MNSGDDLTALKARAGDAIQVFTFTDILVSLRKCAVLLLSWLSLFRNISLFNLSDSWWGLPFGNNGNFMPLSFPYRRYSALVFCTTPFFAYQVLPFTTSKAPIINLLSSFIVRALVGCLVSRPQRMTPRATAQLRASSLGRRTRRDCWLGWFFARQACGVYSIYPKLRFPSVYRVLLESVYRSLHSAVSF